MTANIEADQERTGSDREALTEAYSRLAKSVESELLRHALRLTNGDWDWARDLTQDSIVAGYPLYLEGKLAAERNIRAWFMRVLTNRFINQYNRKRKWTSDTSVDDLDAHGPFVERAESPGEAMERLLLDEPLETALRSLPDDQRLCVLLVDVEEMEYAEAARLLQIPIGTVRSRLARARLRLYTLLLPYAKSRGLA
jgi:RNA polymerase sigma-70 factor (ECF subfamily)